MNDEKKLRMRVLRGAWLVGVDIDDEGCFEIDFEEASRLVNLGVAEFADEADVFTLTGDPYTDEQLINALAAGDDNNGDQANDAGDNENGDQDNSAGDENPVDQTNGTGDESPAADADTSEGTDNGAAAPTVAAKTKHLFDKRNKRK